MSEADPSASAPAKPRLKINVSRSASFADPSTTPVAATPGEGGRKVKLRINASQPSTPAPDQSQPSQPQLPSQQPPPHNDEEEAPPAKTKAGRQPKPTMKLVESKKRPREDDDGTDEPRSAGGSAAPKIRIRPTPKATGTQLVLKARGNGKAPVHPPGDGYDSEASDRERDPAIEEQFVLRMPPGEHCEYVRQCMENGKMGVAKSQGGADVAMRFFEEDTRRAIVTVKGQHFAAVMVDLPTITEAMKTWDKKSFMKSADICQMLLVTQKVKNEDEARRAPLPTMLDTHFKWPHGLTPPMHDCVNRRFAKTISRKEIEDKEAEVERLLAEDEKAGSTKWEWVDDRQQDLDDEDGDEDAEGEDAEGDYFGEQEYEEGSDDDLQAQLEAAFADEIAETPATNTETPMTATQNATPAAGMQESIEVDESEEDEDDDDDDDDDEELDADERAQREEQQAVLDMIKDLEKQLVNRSAELEKTTNKILRSRLEAQIKQYKSEIALKKSSIGLETDD